MGKEDASQGTHKTTVYKEQSTAHQLLLLKKYNYTYVHPISLISHPIFVQARTVTFFSLADQLQSKSIAFRSKNAEVISSIAGMLSLSTSFRYDHIGTILYSLSANLEP